VDVCLRATHRRLEIAVALTTDLTREAARIHRLAATSAVALGRLLAGTALLAITGKHEGSTSVQILSKSRIGQIYADCTDDGDARGMARNPDLAFPVGEAERASGRRSLHLAVHPGRISVVRRVASGEYAQSSTQLVTGEIDEDIESYVVHSDQIPTVVACDVVLGEEDAVVAAGGVLVRTMPDGDRDELGRVADRLRGGALARALEASPSAERLLELAAPGAEVVDAPSPLRYRCRCSRERVLASLRMFPVEDLASMVGDAKPVEVNCDLCGRKYPVQPEDLLRAFEDLIKAEG
jgi:molecular chaperone Hsp33